MTCATKHHAARRPKLRSCVCATKRICISLFFGLPEARLLWTMAERSNLQSTGLGPLRQGTCLANLLFVEDQQLRGQTKQPPGRPWLRLLRAELQHPNNKPGVNSKRMQKHRLEPPRHPPGSKRTTNRKKGTSNKTTFIVSSTQAPLIALPNACKGSTGVTLPLNPVKQAETATLGMDFRGLKHS